MKEIEKPLLIIVGAGSGKTLTVATKIAYLLEKSVKPESILALAFNEKAAEELKDRVLGLVGDAEDLCISTFHSFCNQVILDNILSTKLNANFKVITLLKVGDWFSRSNEKVFFEPENQAIEAIQTEITEMAAKIKAASFEPKKKEAGNATTATTPASVTLEHDRSAEMEKNCLSYKIIRKYFCKKRKEILAIEIASIT